MEEGTEETAIAELADEDAVVLERSRRRARLICSSFIVGPTSQQSVSRAFKGGIVAHIAAVKRVAGLRAGRQEGTTLISSRTWRVAECARTEVEDGTEGDWKNR